MQKPSENRQNKVPSKMSIYTANAGVQQTSPALLPKQPTNELARSRNNTHTRQHA